MLGIVLPAYNEEQRLPAALEGLKNALPDALLIVADDGSQDKTAEVARRQGVRIVGFQVNQGRGAAARAGVLEALRLGCDPVVLVDCDLSCPPNEWEKLINALEDGVDVAVASRWLPESVVEGRSFARTAASWCYSFLVRTTTGLPFRDFQCGFKAFTARAARKLFAEEPICPRWSFDTELFLRARQMGLKITEVPVVWRDRPGSKVKLLRDSVQMALALLKLKRVYSSGPAPCLEVGGI